MSASLVRLDQWLPGQKDVHQNRYFLSSMRTHIVRELHYCVHCTVYTIIVQPNAIWWSSRTIWPALYFQEHFIFANLRHSRISAKIKCYTVCIERRKYLYWCTPYVTCKPLRWIIKDCQSSVTRLLFLFYLGCVCTPPKGRKHIIKKSCPIREPTWIYYFIPVSKQNTAYSPLLHPRKHQLTGP